MTRPPDPADPGPDRPRAPADRARFRATLVRVMAVQVVSMILLWLLQSQFSP